MVYDFFGDDVIDVVVLGGDAPVENGGFYREVSEHLQSRENPHSVTKDQVGLGKVPNVATNDQTPTYTEAASLSKLTSGEKLSVAFGKFAKAITDLISHMGNRANPHGVTAEQAGARPSAWTPTAAEVGAAPAGFGLGTNAYMTIMTLEKLDGTTLNGWYQVYIPGTTFNNVGFNTAFLHVMNYEVGKHCVQELYPVGNTTPLVRKMQDGVWGAWECVNPPMNPGVEYRTTERWHGMPVYAKNVVYKDTAGMSGMATITIPHGISGFTQVVHITGYSGDYLIPCLETDTAYTGLMRVDANSIYMTINNAHWGPNRYYHFCLHYTKSA